MRRGDTLWRIATRYGVSPGAVQAANGLTGFALTGEELLVIPPPAVAPGSRGRAVRILQDLLRRTGHDPGLADGSFGPRTEAALRAFFQVAGADPEVEPVVSPAWWGALWREAQARPPVGGRVAIVAGQAVLRLGPGEHRRPVRILPFGTELEVLQKLGRWLQVATSERRRGWLRQELVSAHTQGESQG